MGGSHLVSKEGLLSTWAGLIVHAVSTFRIAGTQDAWAMQRQSVSQETIQPDRLSRLSIKPIDFASQMGSQTNNLLICTMCSITLETAQKKQKRRNRNRQVEFRCARHGLCDEAQTTPRK
ncbi:hypothetical protein N7449_007670 [Penicillium cf. viridicatum]|uniref:Uncharacterized protein n=1 Tax=Penicillium cf. viridicatum TaxID=2972119 RepID=A0A9W9JMV9_9EURO|nr:hypothetical protein N7449_007670 [Penicillium cf. viridicatum]